MNRIPSWAWNKLVKLSSNLKLLKIYSFILFIVKQNNLYTIIRVNVANHFVLLILLQMPNNICLNKYLESAICWF